MRFEQKNFTFVCCIIREKEISIWVSECSVQPELKEQNGGQKAGLEGENNYFLCGLTVF